MGKQDGLLLNLLICVWTPDGILALIQIRLKSYTAAVQWLQDVWGVAAGECCSRLTSPQRTSRKGRSHTDTRRLENARSKYHLIIESMYARISLACRPRTSPGVTQ